MKLSSILSASLLLMSLGVIFGSVLGSSRRAFLKYSTVFLFRAVS